MPQDVHGFGPPCEDFSHRLFLQGNQSAPTGNQLTLIVVHDAGGVRLAVEFPGSDASAEILEPTATKGSFHQFSLLAPTGTPVVDLVPVGPDGAPLVELCSRYRPIQDLFEARPPPKLATAGGDEADDELAAMEARLGGDGRSESCVLCGELAAREAGVSLAHMDANEVDALRLMLPHVDSQTFVCFPCRERRLGARERMLGGAGRAQAVGYVVARVVLRGYLAALLARHQLGVTDPTSTTLVAFVGSFVPLEMIPVVIVALARGALGMLAVLLAPLMLVAFFMSYPDETMRIMTGDLNLLLQVTGLTSGNLLHEVVVERGVLGALLASGVAFAAGGGDTRALTALGERLRDKVRELLAGATSKEEPAT